MRPFGLRIRIVVCFAVVILLLATAIILFVRIRLSQTLRSCLINKGINIAITLSDQSIKPILTENIFALTELMKDLKRNDADIYYVFALDEKGNVLAHTFEKGFPKDLARINMPSRNQKFSVKLLKTNDGFIRDIAVPVLRGKTALHVGLSENYLRKVVTSTIQKIEEITLVVLLMGIVAVLSVSDLIMSPIRKLMNAVDRIRDGNLDHKVSIESNDEIGQLALSFNQMARSLKERMEERRQMEEKERELLAQIFQQEKMALVGQLTASVAHELNTPLGTILMYSQILGEETEGKEHHTYAKNIEEQTKRCKRIIEDLLDFSRRSEGKRTLQDVNDLIVSSMSLVEHDLRLRKIESKLSLQDNISEKIMADRNQMQQVLFNIINNAADAMPYGGQIEISTYSNEENTHVEIKISDTGSGIKESEIKHIFEPFYTTKDVGKGTGLGLAICDRIVKDHDGTIGVESIHGKGATFIITLPLYDGKSDVKPNTSAKSRIASTGSLI